MKNLLLTGLFALGALFNTQAQDAEPINFGDNTEVYVYDNENATLFLESESIVVGANTDVTYGVVSWFVMTQLDEGKVDYFSGLWGLFRDKTTSKGTYTVDFMFNGDRNSLFTTELFNYGSSYSYVSGVGQKIIKSDFFHVRVTINGKKYVYKFDTTTGFGEGLSFLNNNADEMKNTANDPFSTPKSEDPFKG